MTLPPWRTRDPPSLLLSARVVGSELWASAQGSQAGAFSPSRVMRHCWHTARLCWKHATVPGRLPMIPKPCGAAREGETKLLFPAGCLGHSTAEQTTMLTPLPLACRDAGTSTCLLLLLGFLPTMPTWHPPNWASSSPFLAPLLQARWVLPHGSGELCPCSAHFSAPL